jgi:hypothetical protein
LNQNYLEILLTVDLWDVLAVDLALILAPTL